MIAGLGKRLTCGGEVGIISDICLFVVIGLGVATGIDIGVATACGVGFATAIALRTGIGVATDCGCVTTDFRK